MIISIENEYFFFSSSSCPSDLWYRLWHSILMSYMKSRVQISLKCECRDKSRANSKSIPLIDSIFFYLEINSCSKLSLLFRVIGSKCIHCTKEVYQLVYSSSLGTRECRAKCRAFVFIVPCNEMYELYEVLESECNMCESLDTDIWRKT